MKECCVARIDDLLIAKLLILCEQIAAAESLGSCFRYSPKLVSWHRSLKFQRRQYRLWFLQSLAMPPCQHLLQSKRLFPKKYYLILV
ncbi:hypothetical protein O6H91_02G081400 [Diphasiastrum complanatum]|uniref:Uncharacterized protein n=1 Tax=Diphasiastrum complanatum TaxID=34168 RepID=A0ACC2EHQ2_DIPCM|nr:hypothetical protein O6H91_02G081400 [Diphasiastrum complanatum]